MWDYASSVKSGLMEFWYGVLQWVVKTRMILQVNTAGGTAGNYRSVGHALQTILRTEGMSGLYAGFVPGLFGTLHGAVQFMVYEVGEVWIHAPIPRAHGQTGCPRCCANPARTGAVGLCEVYN
jgi:hypothetical protein